MDGGQVGGVAAPLRAAVDGLLAADYAVVPPAELARLLAELEVQRCRLEALDARVIAALSEQAAPVQFGATSLPDLVGGLARVTRAEARARAQRAVDVTPRRSLSGEVLAPIHPRTARALTAGEISGAHVEVITRYLSRIPAGIAHETFDAAESFLVQAARHEDPAALRRSAELLLARLDPDGAEPRDEVQQRERSFTLGGHGDPRVVSGRFTDETTAVWQAILDSLAAPQPGTDGARDERSAGQRRHDAMLEAGLRLLNSGNLPDTGGVPVSVIVRVEAADLTRSAAGKPAAVAQTGHGEVIRLDRFLRLADQAEISTVALTATGGVLDYGRVRRLASCEQRRALTARDGGCCFPGCTRPAAWCQAHHIRAWLEGGTTSLDNLCLLCAYHHRSFEAAGWTVQMADGRPEWVPPAWLDPRRRPRHNTAHHLPEIKFALAGG